MQAWQSDMMVGGDRSRCQVTSFHQLDLFLDHVQREKRQIDCLLFENNPDLKTALSQLRQRSIFLPAIVLEPEPLQPVPSADAIFDELLQESDAITYHSAILHVPVTQFSELEHLTEKAINQFLKLSATPSSPSLSTTSRVSTLATHSSLIQQQRRLSEKLSERLGYLGVYYKRNSANFLRHMPPPERQEFLEQLKAEYREIILRYFIEDSQLNEKIDNFVNLAFFADVPVAQVVEIHMELMDEFAKQLKLEGRNDEILLDYRLTLIDVIAHLCEMYRRSIPREA
ncbi:circadian clock protein KaiA [Thermoleptolyngbya sp. C42_A2020_037]|uniref:circadian clock protein KaiA n=1 Tax=Thermoleptolyngbya sp. C42_A2020_037 TaxID=2747799 RepID=UPI0025E371F2|nr:circadian clock protein KaiA [Thermoleptolyngbya sp. C42_A2020_037]